MREEGVLYIIEYTSGGAFKARGLSIPWSDHLQYGKHEVEQESKKR